MRGVFALGKETRDGISAILLLRVMLWSLAAAALCGVLAVLFWGTR